MTRDTASGTTAERRFYSGMAIFMILVVLIGFAPSFYFRGLVHVPRPNPTLSPLVMLHGLMFSLWMLLFLAQVRLVAAGRRDLHRRLGMWSMVFAAALIPLMIATTIGQVARANQPPGFTALGWTAVPAFGIPVYAGFIWGGWVWRYMVQTHKRFMLAAALLMMDPAIGRLPIFPPTPGSTVLSDIAGWSPFLALFVWDWVRMRRFHWVTLATSGVWAVVLVFRAMALTSPTWEKFAKWVVALAGG